VCVHQGKEASENATAHICCKVEPEVLAASVSVRRRMEAAHQVLGEEHGRVEASSSVVTGYKDG